MLNGEGRVGSHTTRRFRSSRVSCSRYRWATESRAKWAKQGPLWSSTDLVSVHYGATSQLRDPARQAVPLLLAAYRALGTLVVALDMHPRPRVERWELPWARSFAARGSARMRHVRLPAAAVLAAADSELVPVLILPDVGTAPVVAYRPVLKRLLELRQISQTTEELLLVIVTTDLSTSGERPAAWRNLLHRVTAQAGEPPLRTRILTWPCARGRCRPDGYGCYRRGVARFGFFLEYDRGTERAREYAAKLEAYYRYRDSGSAARDYIGFPSVLVVTTRARAEEQIAYQAFLASERHSRALPLLLTTTRQIEVHAEGILGPIWRAPGPLGGIVLRRCYWLPGGHPNGLLRSLRDGPPANTSVVTASSWSAKGAR